MKNTRGWRFAAVVCLFVGVLAPAGAVSIDVDLSGDFVQDNDVLTVNFSLDSDRLVTIFTSSHLAVGNGMGFDTAFFLWDSAGNWLGLFNDDSSFGGSALSNGVSHGYGEYDAYLNAFLGAGDYILTLVQTGNFPSPTNLSAGFGQDAQPNYTRDVFGWGPNDYFNGAFGVDPRTGHYDLHLVGVTDYSVDGASTPIPEPTSMMLMLLGGSLFAVRRRHNNR